MAKKSFFEENSNFIIGGIMMLIGLAIFYFRPQQVCTWYDIFCQIGQLQISVFYIGLAILVFVLGFMVFIKANFFYASLFVLFLILLVIDLIIPDPLPIVDELLLSIGMFFTGFRALPIKQDNVRQIK